MLTYLAVALLAVLVLIEARNMRLLYTILVELRDVLDEQPYRKQRAEQQRAALIEAWRAKAGISGPSLPVSKSVTLRGWVD